MGVMITKDEDKNAELSRKINSDLREKVSRTQNVDGNPNDEIGDPEYLKDFEETGKFSWIWIILIILAIVSLVFIIIL